MIIYEKHIDPSFQKISISKYTYDPLLKLLHFLPTIVHFEKIQNIFFLFKLDWKSLFNATSLSTCI